MRRAGSVPASSLLRLVLTSKCAALRVRVGPVGRGAFAEGVRAGQRSIKILLEACFVRPFVIAGKISVAEIFADALGRNGMQLDRTEV